MLRKPLVNLCRKIKKRFLTLFSNFLHLPWFPSTFFSVFNVKISTRKEHVLNVSRQLLQEIKRKHMNQARCLSTNAVSLSRQKCFVLRRVSCCNRESSGFELAYRSSFFGCKQRIGWGLAVSRSPFATTVAHQLKKSDQGTDRKLSRSVALFQITFFFPVDFTMRNCESCCSWHPYKKDNNITAFI